MEPGTVVYLKSGGHHMTVEKAHKVDGYDKLHCVWFNDAGDLFQADFDEVVLEACSPSEIEI